MISYERVQLNVGILAHISLGFVLIRFPLLWKNASNCVSYKQKQLVLSRGLESQKSESMSP